MAAEGGTSGKNTTTDQRQIQATSQSGAVIVGDKVNTGLSAGGDIFVTDGGIAAEAFQFGDNIAQGLFDVINKSQEANVETTANNTAFLSGVLSSLQGDTKSGDTNKTILYLGVGAIVVVGLIFLRK